MEPKKTINSTNGRIPMDRFDFVIGVWDGSGNGAGKFLKEENEGEEKSEDARGRMQWEGEFDDGSFTQRKYDFHIYATQWLWGFLPVWCARCGATPNRLSMGSQNLLVDGVWWIVFGVHAFPVVPGEMEGGDR